MKRIILLLLLCVFSLYDHAETEWNNYKIRPINNQDKLPGKQVTKYSRIVKGICGLLPITVYAPTTDTL